MKEQIDLEINKKEKKKSQLKNRNVFIFCN